MTERHPIQRLPGGGESGALIRAQDWSATSLGPIADWPSELLSTLATLLNSPLAQVMIWGAARIDFSNDAFRTNFGTSTDIVNADVLTRMLRGESVGRLARDLPITCRGCTETRHFDLFHTPVHDATGAIAGVICTVIEPTVIDTTELTDARTALPRHSIAFERSTDALPFIAVHIDVDHCYRFANAFALNWHGVELPQLVGRHVRDALGEALYEHHRPHIERALTGETLRIHDTRTNLRGERKRLELHYLPTRDSSGRIDGVQVIAVDLEDTLIGLDEEHHNNNRFRTAMDAVHGILWTNSADGRMLGEQPGWAQLTGQTYQQYQDFGWTAVLHPDDVEPTLIAWHEALADKRMFVFEHRLRNCAGEWRTFLIRALPIIGDDGEIVEWVGVHTDITHQRAAEQSLREINETLEARVAAEIEERREAEAKLAQAQKMETVGKLTGGVAHDFNNLLQVIGGNLQLLSRDVAGNARAEQRIANALAGVTRGARLAAQLLAFGRRQALEPKAINIARLVQGMDDMLHRALGGAIEVETVFSGGLWNTFIDPAQVENALLNLVINARDAMDGTGRLTIELANSHLDDGYARTHDEVTAGQYVMLAVSDTGCGISPDILDKVFEPFFSTKPEGKGSGLGLSMVYGFVKQSGGHIKIYSEPGEGTTIRLYLPRAAQSEDIPVPLDAGPVLGGSETVLVVEDDDEVRTTVVELLAELGYGVLKAVDAASALNVIESGVPIDVLFTDVVMPGTLKSPELARRARERLPSIAVLFTSGYTENSIVHGGRLDPGVDLLSKPYTREALARKLAHVLTAQRQNAGIESAGIGSAGIETVSPSSASEPALRVLFVEDDELIRLHAAEILAESGFAVREAESAEQALAELANEVADVIVTDIHLPGLNGTELAAHARQMHPRIGIVFASGEAEPLRAGELAGSVSLPKPYNHRALLEAITQARRLAQHADSEAADEPEPDEQRA